MHTQPQMFEIEQEWLDAAQVAPTPEQAKDEFQELSSWLKTQSRETAQPDEQVSRRRLVLCSVCGDPDCAFSRWVDE